MIRQTVQMQQQQCTSQNLLRDQHFQVKLKMEGKSVEVSDDANRQFDCCCLSFVNHDILSVVKRQSSSLYNEFISNILFCLFSIKNRQFQLSQQAWLLDQVPHHPYTGCQELPRLLRQLLLRESCFCSKQIGIMMNNLFY